MFSRDFNKSRSLAVYKYCFAPVDKNNHQQHFFCWKLHFRATAFQIFSGLKMGPRGEGGMSPAPLPPRAHFEVTVAYYIIGGLHMKNIIHPPTPRFLESLDPKINFLLHKKAALTGRFNRPTTLQKAGYAPVDTMFSPR